MFEVLTGSCGQSCNERKTKQFLILRSAITLWIDDRGEKFFLHPPDFSKFLNLRSAITLWIDDRGEKFFLHPLIFPTAAEQKALLQKVLSLRFMLRPLQRVQMVGVRFYFQATLISRQSSLLICKKSGMDTVQGYHVTQKCSI